jgi:hypothetical protein
MVCLIAPPYPSSIASTSEPDATPHVAPTLDAPAHVTRGLGFMLHRAPPGVPATSNPCVGSSVYHPVTMARDPRSTHLMVTHHATGFTKHVDRLQLSATATPPTLSPILTSVRSALADPPTGVALWRSTRLYYLTARGTWFLDLLGPTSSPTSGS